MVERQPQLPPSRHRGRAGVAASRSCGPSRYGELGHVAPNCPPAGSPLDSLLPPEAFSADSVLSDLAALLEVGDPRVRDTLARHWPLLRRLLGRDAVLVWKHAQRLDHDSALAVLDRLRG